MCTLIAHASTLVVTRVGAEAAAHQACAVWVPVLLSDVYVQKAGVRPINFKGLIGHQRFLRMMQRFEMCGQGCIPNVFPLVVWYSELALLYSPVPL